MRKLLKLKKEIRENFTFYEKGDMKKMTKFIKNKGYTISSIIHNPNYMGWGVAVSEVELIVDGDYVTVQLHWDMSIANDCNEL